MLACSRNRCRDCAGCISLCPEAALYMDLTGMKIRSDVCTLCGLCVRFCPVAALTIVGVGMGTPMGAP